MRACRRKHIGHTGKEAGRLPRLQATNFDAPWTGGLRGVAASCVSTAPSSHFFPLKPNPSKTSCARGRLLTARKKPAAGPLMTVGQARPQQERWSGERTWRVQHLSRAPTVSPVREVSVWPGTGVHKVRTLRRCQAFSWPPAPQGLAVRRSGPYLDKMGIPFTDLCPAAPELQGKLGWFGRCRVAKCPVEAPSWQDNGFEVSERDTHFRLFRRFGRSQPADCRPAGRTRRKAHAIRCRRGAIIPQSARVWPGVRDARIHPRRRRRSRLPDGSPRN